MWKPWRDDTADDLAKCFSREISLRAFSGERLRTKVLKNDADTDHVLEILANNFEKVLLYQKHLLNAGCPKYPEVSFDRFLMYVEKV